MGDCGCCGVRVSEECFAPYWDGETLSVSEGRKVLRRSYLCDWTHLQPGTYPNKLKLVLEREDTSRETVVTTDLVLVRDYGPLTPEEVRQGISDRLDGTGGDGDTSG
ncbi:hypothetical protein ACFLQN_02875 [Candidatus Aenigmatarchaeota archaeon]